MVEGGDGFDRVGMRGASAAENVVISANDGRTLVSNNGATLDLNGVERIDFGAIGGADNVTVNDLTGTGMVRVAVDLAASLNGSAPDGQIDQVTVNGGIAGETVNITHPGRPVIVTRFAAPTPRVPPPPPH